MIVPNINTKSEEIQHQNTNKVFVDTMIFGYATATKIDQVTDRALGTIKKSSGEERQAIFSIHDYRPRSPKRVDNSLAKEIKEIKTIASLATQGAIDLVYSHEVDLELIFQPLIDVMPGRFFGAPCRLIRSPLMRVNALPDRDSDESSHTFIHHPSKRYEKYRAALQKYPDRFEDILREFLLFLPVGNVFYQLDFRHLLIEFIDPNSVNAALLMLPMLERIQEERYRSLLKMLNANSAKLHKRANIYMDAYHLWTAECSECDFFLTTDNGILRQYKSDKLSVVRPKGLVSSI